MKSMTAVSFLVVSCVLLLATACENPGTGKPEAQVSEPAATASPAEVAGRDEGGNRLDFGNVARGRQHGSTAQTVADQKRRRLVMVAEVVGGL